MDVSWRSKKLKASMVGVLAYKGGSLVGRWKKTWEVIEGLEVIEELEDERDDVLY